MVKLVRKILQNEFRDDTTANSKRSGKKNSKSQQSQARREKREEVQLPPGLLQALKATVDEQQNQEAGHRSHEERSVRSGQIHNNNSSTHKAASGTAARPLAVGKADTKTSDMEESTMALIDSIVKGSDDPALLEALQAMMDESEGDTAYHKETLALVAESLVEKQAAKKALERAAQAETRLQESLKKVAPDLVNDTAAYVDHVDTASGSNKNNNSSSSALNRVTASWTSMSTPVHRRIPVLTFPKKNKNATPPREENTTTNPTGDISVDTLRDDADTYQGTDEGRLLTEEQPKKRKNKYKDIVHKKPEIPLYNPSYDSRDDQCTFAETFEDRDNYTQCSGSYGEGEETLQSIQSGQSSSESEAEDDEVQEQEDGEEDVELKIKYTLFELESKLSMSSANVSVSSAGDCSSHDDQEEEDHTDQEVEAEEEESDSGIGDESDSDEEENEPFFASFCQRIQSEDEEDEEENDHKSSRSRKSRHHTEETEEAASSILKCVSGYFGRGEQEEPGESDDDDVPDSDDDSATRREKRRRRREGRKSRRKEERRSRRSSSGHRRRRRH